MRFLNRNKQSSDGRSEVLTVQKFFKHVRQSLDNNILAKTKYFLIIPAFLSLLIQANKDYLLSYNVSYEIAKYLHFERPIADDQLTSTLNSILIYNLDKDKLELELRKLLITRLLDRNCLIFDLEQEQI